MILKFCDDNFLFYITHTKYFDILCYFVIFLLIALFILVQKNDFIEKVKKSKFKMFFIILFSGFFVGFLIFLFAWLLNKDTFNGCSTRYYQNIYFKTESTINETVNNLKNSKVIIVGDSRMERIVDDESINIPSNFTFVAKSSMKINWFKNTALSRVRKILTNDKYKYHIVINMGVNDLDEEQYNGDEIASEYFELYNNLAKKYSTSKIYILSVNPINEDMINERWHNGRTTKKVKAFNSTIKKELDNSELNNIYYCDSYNTLDFKTKDGLHYTQDTNREIINYIVNKCVKF